MSKRLYQATKKIWLSKNREKLSTRWASELENAIVLSKNLTRFHQWSPLKVFTSLSNAKKPKPVFSLRYRGQEVAKIIADDRPLLNITKNNMEKNFKCFGLMTKSNIYPWDGLESRIFRKQFRDFDRAQISLVKMKSDEAWLQSIVFETMRNTSDAGYHAVQPVLFTGFPFQCPVPISANTGRPKATRGNIDVLTRRGRGRNIHPAIWELKKPKQCKNAFEQVYIYGVTFALMLRSNGGESWYKNMGFGSKLMESKSITIDIVTMITKDSKNELLTHLKEFNDPLKLSNENIILRPYVAYYEWDKLKEKVHIEELADLSNYIKKQ